MSRIHKLENVYKEQLKNSDIKQISDFIQSVVDADITRGKYARFLIESFLNDKFLEEDLIGGLNSTVGQSISLFHKHKNKLPENMRSVYALNSETKLSLYQSPGDLWNSVKQYQGELSGKELKKEEQEKIYRETEFISKNEETGFQIISPLTEESAKWWGKGTRWCTSAEKNNMFWYYAKDSPLFITLMPNGDKLQLWKDEDNIQFMDEADNEIKLEYIEKHWNILEPICKWLNDLKFIPEKYRDYNICLEAVKQNGFALYYVPKELRTKELCEIAVQQNGYALEYVPDELITKELCELVIQRSGLSLFYVPARYKTKEFCELAVSHNGYALKYVPEKLKIPQLCETAVSHNGLSLKYVPEKLKTPELCEIAVKQNLWALEYVPEKLKIKELCELAIQHNGWSLQYVPEKFITPELCKLAVSHRGRALQKVPRKHITKELCELAVKQNGEALKWVPKEHRTKELCELAVKQNGEALKCPSVELQHYVKDKILELPIEKYQEIFQEIKIFFPTKDVSLSYHS